MGQEGDHVGKTLVFSFDGTGNEPADAGGFKQDESVSNILKLHLMLGGGIARRSSTAAPSGRVQTAYYYNGIGTRENGINIPLLGSLYSAGARFLNRAIAPSFGDAQQILDEAEADLADIYAPSDNIVIFGFSRGAALARQFANILLRADEHRRVAFLGVFDTVSAIGGVHRHGEKTSSDVLFENGTLHVRIDKAVHLVAIDEDRVPFTPTLINKDRHNPQRITEVWFPGVHGDVGGGYWIDGLSDLALDFMIARCRESLGDDIAVTDDLVAEAGADAKTQISPDDIALEARFDAPVHLHAGPKATALNQDVRSIHVAENDEASNDLPVLHYAVKLRIDRLADYRPAALRGLAHTLWLGERRLSPPIHGINGLRRYALPWWWRLRRNVRAGRDPSA